MRAPLVLALMVCGTLPAAANSLAVMAVSANEVIIAADSRVMLGDIPYTDQQCKVAALGRKIIFANTGVTAELGRYRMQWDAVEEAKRVIHGLSPGVRSGDDLLLATANEWAGRVRDRFQFKPGAHNKGERTMTSGVFAGVNAAGDLSLVRADVAPLIDGAAVLVARAERLQPPGNVALYLLGNVDVAKEFNEQTTERARREAVRWRLEAVSYPPRDRLARWAIRLVEISSRYDRRVGGPVDAVELRRDGTIRWIQRKQNCTD